MSKWLVKSSNPLMIFCMISIQIAYLEVFVLVCLMLIS